MARSDPQLNIRIPIELKEKLEKSARISGRSVTAEMIKLLEGALTGRNLEMNSTINFQPSATFQLGKSEDELDRLADKIVERLKDKI